MAVLLAIAGGWLGAGGAASAQGSDPVAQEEYVQVQLNPPMAILVDLLANDSSPAGEPLQAVIQQGPEVGALVPQWDGSFVYRLDAGDDLAGRTYVTASYWVEDASGRASDVVDVCIGECVSKITATARTDSFSIPIDHSIAVPVLDNDSGDGLQLVSCDATATTSGTVGTQNDTCSYTATQVGNDSFQYTIVDIYGNTATGTVSGTVSGPSGQVMGVVGRLTGVTGDFQTVAFGSMFGVSFDHPVVIAQPITLNGLNDATLEVTDVTATSFRVRVANTPPALPNHYQGEDVSYLVVEGGSWEIAPGVWLDAGVAETDVTYFGPNDYSQAGPRLVLLPQAYPAGVLPLVLTQLQTNNAGSWSQARQLDLSEDRFDLVLQRGEVDQDARVAHPVPERVGWVAITQGTGSWAGKPYAAEELTCPGGAHPVVCGAGFPVSFAAPPNLLAQIVSFNDPEPAFLRYQNLTATSVALILSETYATTDEDGGHATEDFGYLVVGGDGTLTATGVDLPPTAFDQDLEVAQDESIEFGAKGSDPDGDQLRFGTYSLDGEGFVYPEVFSYLLGYQPPLGFSGTVTVRYTVQDDFADHGLESHNMGVATIHVRPLVAAIAAPQCFGSTCTFDGSPSSPEAVSYSWTIRNTVTGAVSTYLGKTVTHTFSSGGRHLATLTVTNAAGSTATTTETLDLPPTAGWAASCDANRVCSFIPSGTTADATSFTWSFGDGTTSSASAPTHGFTAGGRYLVTLTVRNAIGLEDAVASFLDLPPTAAFGFDCQGRTCNFTPTGTSADAETFSWDFNDGATSLEQQPAHTFAVGGRYQVRLTVGNALGLESTAVQAVDLPPTAAFTVSCDRGLCSFDAGVSSADGTLFQWDFGDGSSGSGQTVSHQYAVVDGVFTARLTVTNGVGLTDSAEQTVVIELPDDLFLLLYVLD